MAQLYFCGRLQKYNYSSSLCKQTAPGLVVAKGDIVRAAKNFYAYCEVLKMRISFVCALSIRTTKLHYALCWALIHLYFTMAYMEKRTYEKIKF